MTKLSIPYSDVSLRQIIRKGNKILQQQHQDKQKDIRDNLRGGNSGCLTESGEIYGCHRTAIARALDLEVPASEENQRYFDVGLGIEDQLLPKLEAGWSEDIQNVLTEEDIPVQWRLDSGRLVTGRPDFVLLERQDRILGVELKTICAPNSAFRVYYQHKPEAKHVCQSGHYMWQHNCPWVLTYISPTKQALNFFRAKEVTPERKPWGPDMPTYESHFYLSYRDDRLYYRLEGKDEVESVVTVEGIRNYYQLVEECLETKQLLDHPVSKYPDGSDMPYRHEDYCDYCKAATEAGGNWNEWVEILRSKKREKVSC